MSAAECAPECSVRGAARFKVYVCHGGFEYADSFYRTGLETDGQCRGGRECGGGFKWCAACAWRLLALHAGEDTGVFVNGVGHLLLGASVFLCSLRIPYC